MQPGEYRCPWCGAKFTRHTDMTGHRTAPGMTVLAIDGRELVWSTRECPSSPRSGAVLQLRR